MSFSKISTLALGLCLASGAALADDHMSNSSISLSGNVAIVTDYVFRGISQSDENFALQGGFDAEHDSGLYAGVWASNVDFNDGDEADIEIDLYAGYGGEVNGVSYDAGVLYYAYPGADDTLDYDFWEVYGSLGYDFDFASANIAVNYSPEFFGDSGEAVYTNLNIDVPITDALSFGTGIGYQSIEGNNTEEYTDWRASLNYAYNNMNFFLSYHETDLDEPNECADGCDARVVLGMSADFGI